MMAQHLKPMPPKETGFVSQPPMAALQAFVAALAEMVKQHYQEPELPKVDILVPKAKTLVERKKATGMDDQEFFFEDQKPKLPNMTALPSKANQLERPLPKWLTDRWSADGMDEAKFHLIKDHEDQRHRPEANKEGSAAAKAYVDFVEVQADTYQVEKLYGLQLFATLLENPTKPLQSADIFNSAGAFAQLRPNKDSENFMQDIQINLVELSIIAPHGIRSKHWALLCEQRAPDERKILEAEYVERLKPVYQQLGGDVEHPEKAGVDYRLFLVVLIGLAELKVGKEDKMIGERDQQEQARKRLIVAIKILCPHDEETEGPEAVEAAKGKKKKGKKRQELPGRPLEQDELFILILGMHLIFIENSFKLHEIVKKKVDILLENAQEDTEFANNLTTTKFPRLATHGAATTNLVFPTVHEIAALNLVNFPDCFRTLEGQTLLNRIPRKAKYVNCQPGSVEFLAQEMPEEIPVEDQQGDESPFLNQLEKQKFRGSEFFDPETIREKEEKEYRRARACLAMRMAKEAEKQQESTVAIQEEVSEVKPEEVTMTVEWHTDGAAMPEGLLTTEADWAVPAVPDLKSPVEVSQGEIADEELDLPPEPVLPTPEWNQEIAVAAKGEIADEELDLPPEPVLPTPEWNQEIAVTAKGEIADEELDLPPEPVLPTPEWKQEIAVTAKGEIADEELDLPPEPVLPIPEWNQEIAVTAKGDLQLDLPPEPVLPTPDWNHDSPVRKRRGLPEGGALMNLSDEDFDMPPPPQLLSPPARPKSGQDVPRLPLVMQHAHEPQPLLPTVQPHELDDPRFWTYERYQRRKSELRFSSSCCACETMKERHVKLALFALLLVGLSVLAFGMRQSFSDKMASEAILVLSAVFFFLGCITCCRSCIRRAQDEAVESQLNHPDAAIGRPLIDALDNV